MQFLLILEKPLDTSISCLSSYLFCLRKMYIACLKFGIWRNSLFFFNEYLAFWIAYQVISTTKILKDINTNINNWKIKIKPWYFFQQILKMFALPCIYYKHSIIQFRLFSIQNRYENSCITVTNLNTNHLLKQGSVWYLF